MGQIHDVGGHIFTDSWWFRSSGGVHGLLCGECFGDVRQSMPVAFVASCSNSVQTRRVRTHSILTLPRFAFISQGFFCIGWTVFLRDNIIATPTTTNLCSTCKACFLKAWIPSFPSCWCGGRVPPIWGISKHSWVIEINTGID